MTSATDTAGPRPFFIVGCDRSGTTMLRLVLDRHPQIAIPTESMFITDFLTRLSRYGDLSSRSNRLKLAGDMLSYSKVRNWQLPLTADELASNCATTDVYASMVRAIFTAYALKHGKTCWGDKTPYYVHWVDDLKRLFPDARFIHLVRDGRDVALSLIRVGFGPTNVYAAARYWRESVRKGRSAVERLGGDAMEVHYERFVDDPMSVSKTICGFLDIGFDEKMLDIQHARSEGKFAPNQDNWFTKVDEGINASSVGRWRKHMSTRQRVTFQAIAADELDLFGYSLESDLPAVTFRSIRFAMYRADDFLRRSIQWFRLHVIDERCADVGNILRRHAQRLFRRRRSAP